MEDEDQVSPRPGERFGSLGRTALWVLLSGACYYLATEIAWALCFPNSKVSLLFPPHAVLVSVLLLVPTRHWWAYTLAAICGHFLATQQAHWPLLYSLHCEAFDAVQNVAVAAGIRIFLKSPLKFITLREAIVFVLIAVIIVPFGTAFWGAAFTLSNHYGTALLGRMAQPGNLEWRNRDRAGAGHPSWRPLSVRQADKGHTSAAARGGSPRSGHSDGRNSSSSTNCPPARILRLPSCMRRYPCSSGRRSASDLAE